MPRPFVPLATIAALSALSAACHQRIAAEPPPAVAAVEGVVARVDRDPWAYDGNAVMDLRTDAGGIVEVQVPARMNLCTAQGLDAFASLAAGARVQVAGEASGPDRITVCTGPTHYLRVVSP